MSNEIKYVVQGALLTMLFLFIVSTVQFISSIQFYTPAPALIDVDIVQKEVDAGSSSENIQSLFTTNCASCHSVYKRLTGPPLAGLEQRSPWKDKKQLYAWIHNPSAFMKHDTYTSALYKEYQVMMPAFPNLSNSDIDKIIESIQNRNYSSLPTP